MSAQPCTNPSCNSYGKPHPNCRCAEEFAEGGVVGDFDSLKEDAPAVAPSFDDLKEDAPNATLSFDDLKEDGGDVAAEPTSQPLDLETQTPADGTPVPGELSMPSSLSDAAGRLGKAGLFRTPEEDKPEGTKLSDEDIKSAGASEEKAAETAMLIAPETDAVKAAGKVAAKTLGLGIKGASALKDAVKFGLVEGATQAQKALLGQGSPEGAVNPYMAVMIQSLIGAGTGFLGGAATQATTKAMEGPIMKAAANAEHWLTGAGLKAAGEALPKGASEAMEAGHSFIGDIAGRAGEKIGKTAARVLTMKTGVRAVPGIGKKLTRGLENTAAEIIGHKILKPIIGRPLQKVSEYAGPAVLRWLQNGAQGSVYNMIDYAAKVQKGESLINNSIGALFRGGEHAAFEVANDGDVEALRKKVDDGGLEQDLQDENVEQHDVPQFAEGGQVEQPKKFKIHDHDHIAQNMPEQNALIQTAKGRIFNYLSSQRPQKHAPKLAFDDEPDDREQKKSYDRALAVAVHPIGVLKHVNDGTIDPDHVKHLTAMYPELTGHLQQKLVEQVTQAQMDGKKPSFKVRQGLSVLLGAPMSGEFTPQSIQAAQAVFAPRKASSPQSKDQTSAGKASLTKSEQAFLTDDQARMRRQQKV